MIYLHSHSRGVDEFIVFAWTTNKSKNPVVNNKGMESTLLIWSKSCRASIGGCGCGRGQGGHNNFNNRDEDGDKNYSKGKDNCRSSILPS